MQTTAKILWDQGGDQEEGYSETLSSRINAVAWLLHMASGRQFERMWINHQEVERNDLWKEREAA